MSLEMALAAGVPQGEVRRGQQGQQGQQCVQQVQRRQQGHHAKGPAEGYEVAPATGAMALGSVDGLDRGNGQGLHESSANDSICGPPPFFEAMSPEDRQVLESMVRRWGSKHQVEQQVEREGGDQQSSSSHTSPATSQPTPNLNALGLSPPPEAAEAAEGSVEAAEGSVEAADSRREIELKYGLDVADIESLHSYLRQFRARAYA